MGSQKMLGQKHFGSKKVWLEKFWSKIILCPKYFESKKILGQKEFWFKKIKTPTKLGQEQLNYSWYEKKLSAQILPVQMSRWHLESKMVPESYLQSLVKIMSVSAEIFLIWTNVARTNITWTNVTVTVKICSRLAWSSHKVVLNQSLLIWLISSFNWNFSCGWVGGLLDQMEIKPTQPQLKLKLSWIELRLSLAKKII